VVLSPLPTAFAHNMEIYLYKPNFENKIGE
jgi:hypothetical protein